MATITYKCPNCGGDLRFHPQTQKFRCEYCLSEFDEEQMEELSRQAEGEDESAAVGPATQTEGSDKPDCQSESAGQAVLYHCPSCGAQLVTSETTAATICYYCHNPVVLSGRMSGEYHPDKIIPFAVDRKQATEIFDQWISRKRYIPKDFYSKEQIESMTGVYFPYWQYSCRAKGRMEAEGERLQSWVSGTLRYTRTERYRISREGEMPVENVTRCALSRSDRKLVEGVLPFDMSGQQDFEMAYLSGFMAENRDIEKEQVGDAVEDEVRSFAENSLRDGVSGYDSVRMVSAKVDLSDARWSYALLPVWALTYHDCATGQMYYFACNGQTGKVCGKLPLDRRRLALLFAEVAAPLFVAMLLLGGLVGDMFRSGPLLFLLSLGVALFCGVAVCGNVRKSYAMEPENGTAAASGLAFDANAHFTYGAQDAALIGSRVTSCPIAATRGGGPGMPGGGGHPPGMPGGASRASGGPGMRGGRPSGGRPGMCGGRAPGGRRR